MQQIQDDALYNNDGWSVVLLGKKPEDTVISQSLDLESILTVVENTKWERMFFHARLSTTSTAGIFGCHNFTTVGDGRKANVKKGFWIVQHNGILRSPESREYLVDSMYIAEVVRQHGIEAAKAYLTTNEEYANVFLVNPETGMYVVTRSVTNSLYTDNMGNYSTNKFGPMDHPVAHRSAANHFHLWTAKKGKVNPSFSVDEAALAWDIEIRNHDNVIKQECDEWGCNALDLYTVDIKQFAEACKHLGYLDKDAYMETDLFKSLSKIQQRWCRTLGIRIFTPKKKQAAN
jgi:predicted glutamine amidotransferase